MMERKFKEMGIEVAPQNDTYQTLKKLKRGEIRDSLEFIIPSKRDQYDFSCSSSESDSDEENGGQHAINVGPIRS